MRTAAIIAVLMGVIAGGLWGANANNGASTELLVARLVELEAEVQRLRQELEAGDRATLLRVGQLRDQNEGLSGFYGELLEGVDDLRTTVASQKQRAEPVLRQAEQLMKVVRLDKRGDLLVEGANLVVRNGLGTTDMVNGKGNVVLGYNEHANRGDDDRSGSHNLVVGSGHSYTSYGGVVVGYENAVTAPFAAVMGSRNVTATAVAAVHAVDQSIVGGGAGRQAAGPSPTAAVVSDASATAFSARPSPQSVDALTNAEANPSTDTGATRTPTATSGGGRPGQSHLISR